MLIEVIIMPILKNILKVKATSCFLSVISKIITVLAAPKIVKFPTIALPVASAIQDIVSDEEKP